MKQFLKSILVFLMAVAGSLCACAADWRVHTTFDDNIDRIIVTPDYVYVSALAQAYDPRYDEYAKPKIFLFRYDKGSDEMIGLSCQNLLRRNMVNAFEYNHAKKYLLVVYDDFDIDLIYDNGTRKNIPGLKLASMREDKNVNSITFHPSSNRAYLATDFGFIELNDDKGEVVSSRNYKKKIVTAGRFGDFIFVGDENNLYKAPVSSSLFTFDDFQQVKGVEKPVKLFNYNDSQIAVLAGEERFTDLLFIDQQDNSNIKNAYSGYFISKEQLPDGFMISTPSIVLHYIGDGRKEEYNRDSGENSLRVGTRDFREFWFGKGRTGIKSMKCSKTDNTAVWQLTRDYIFPNNTPVYTATSMVHHPNYGLLITNHGIDRNFINFDVRMPNLLCGLNGLEWHRYSPAYTDPELTYIHNNPNGLAVDPDNSNYVYSGSMLDGILRLNLADPSDIMLLGQSRSPNANLPGFIPIAPVIEFWDVMCSFQSPSFDAKGNLWSPFYNLDKEPEIRTDGSTDNESCELWYWPRENRLATKDKSTYRPWGKMVFKDIKMTNASIALPCHSSANSNLVLFIPNTFNGPFIFIDTNGTINSTNDDRQVMMTSFPDQDGKSVAPQFVHSVYEDTATGLLWMGTETGVFTVNPRDIMNGNEQVNRIKVARNDGTDLADYLLDGVTINAITEDGNGRKWFGTAGAGLVCTSSDGRNILAEYTTENSLLSDDTVFGLCYNPSNNSMMISTNKGLVELFLESAGGALDFNSARAYPNPVRPDYYGFVTIDGLVDGALVKIVDAMGNIVKELGFAGAGSLQWDVTNFRHERVKSGVYYVLASTGPDDETGLSKVAKILVVN